MIIKEENQPKLISINEIFSGVGYTIPIYQRSYAWTKDEIEQLINDINESSGNYYLGSLIVNKTSENTFSVIDGQQRLTTLFLLMTFLNKINGAKLSILKNSLSFEARDTSNTTLEYLFDLKNDDEPEKENYTSEIINGYTIIKNYLESAVKKEKTYIELFIQKLSYIYLVRTQVPEKIDLNHYFEIMNTRGEQLEIHEIAKGRLLGAILDPDEKNIAGEIWDACAQMDKYVQMGFDIGIRDEIFGPDWKSFEWNSFSDIREAYKRKQDKLIQLEKDKYKDQPDKIKAISIKITEDTLDNNKFSLVSRFDSKIINDWNNRKRNAIEKEGYERFESIVSFPNFLLIVNEAMNYTNIEDDSKSDTLDDKKFIKTLEKHWKIENENELLASENAKNFIFYLLKFRFWFDTKIIKREYAKNYTEDGKWSLQYLEMYYDGNKNSRKPSYKQVFADNDKRMKLLQSALRITYTSPKTMHWISLALSSIENSKTNEELINILEHYCCQKVKTANFETATGFGIDRIVFTFLDYLLLRDMDKSNRSSKFKTDFSNYEYQYRTSIEHFYPQNPVGGNESWKDKSELNNFGNLALITVKANSKFSNSVPAAKIANDNQGIILQSPKLYLMKESMINYVWNEKLVLKNETEMMDILRTELSNHNL